MKLLKLFAVMSASLLLSACAFKEPKVVYKTTLVAPSDSSLVDCTIDSPPLREKYFIASWSEKEKALVDFGAKQTTNLISCNKRLSELRSWKVEQLKRHNP